MAHIVINSPLNEVQQEYLAEHWQGRTVDRPRKEDWHSHPISAYERRVMEEWAIGYIRDTTKGVPGLIVDIRGNPIRHSNRKRADVWSCCPITGAADLERNRKRQAHFLDTTADGVPSGNHAEDFVPALAPYCLHSAEHCSCPLVTALGVRCYLSVHSLYHMDPDVLARMLSETGASCVAVLHLFPHHGGRLLADEASYTKVDGVVRMRIAGQATTYVHPDMSWLELDHLVTPYGTLVWNTVEKRGSTHVICFSVTQKTFARLSPLTVAAFNLRDPERGGGVQFDIRGLDGPATRAHTMGAFKVRRLYAIGTQLYIDVGTNVVNLPVQAISEAAAMYAYTKITKDSYHTYASGLRRILKKHNLSVEEYSSAIVYGVPIAMTLNINEMSNSMMSSVATRLGDIARYNAHLDMRFPRIFGLKIILMALWMLASTAWWVTVGVEHWDPWLAALPFSGILVVLLLLAPWGVILFWGRRFTHIAKLRFKKRVFYDIATPVPPVDPDLGAIDPGPDQVPPKPRVSHHVGADISAVAAEPDDHAFPDPRSNSNTAHGAIARLLSRDTNDPEHNANWLSLKTEVFKVSDGGFFTRTTQYGATLFNGMGHPGAYPVDDWLASFPKARAGMIVKDYDKWMTEGGQPEQLGQGMQLFVKSEPGMKPRLIVDMRPAFHRVVGPWTRRFGHHLAQDVWNRDACIWYTQGSTTESLGAWHMACNEDLSEPNDPCLFFPADADSFEASNVVEALHFRYAVYEYAGAPDQVLDAYVHTVSWRAANRTGVRVAKDGTTASGKDDTSVGNSLVTGVTHHRYFEHQLMNNPEYVAYLHTLYQYPEMRDVVRMLVNGDDLYVAIRPSAFRALMGSNTSGMSEVIRERFGLTFVYGAVGPCNFAHASLADYCSGYFYYYPDGLCLWGTKPFRAISRTFLVRDRGMDMDAERILAEMKATALSVKKSTTHLPVLRRVVKLSIEAYAPFVKPAFKHDQVSGSRVQREPSWDYIARMYGVNEADLRACEDLLSGPPFNIVSDTAKHCLEIDDKIKTPKFIMHIPAGVDPTLLGNRALHDIQFMHGSETIAGLGDL